MCFLNLHQVKKQQILQAGKHDKKRLIVKPTCKEVYHVL